MNPFLCFNAAGAQLPTFPALRLFLEQHIFLFISRRFTILRLVTFYRFKVAFFLFLSFHSLSSYQDASFFCVCVFNAFTWDSPNSLIRSWLSAPHACQPWGACVRCAACQCLTASPGLADNQRALPTQQHANVYLFGFRLSQPAFSSLASCTKARLTRSFWSWCWVSRMQMRCF